MNLTFKNITALLLALLVCIASASFTVSAHYCGSKLISYAANSKSKSCCKVLLNNSIKNDFSQQSFSCCKSKKVKKEADNDILTFINKAEIHFEYVLLRLPQLNFISNKYFHNNQIDNRLTDFENLLFKEHLPSTNILNQVFII